MTWEPHKLQLLKRYVRASLQQGGPVCRRQSPSNRATLQRNPRGMRGSAHLLNIQVKASSSPLSRTSTTWRLPRSSPPPCRASLHSRSGPHLSASPPRLLLKGTVLNPGPGSPSRPTHQTTSVPAQRLRCVVLATDCAQSAPVGFLPAPTKRPPFRSLIRDVFTIDF